jgi:iron complex outermembrane receptor protein
VTDGELDAQGAHLVALWDRPLSRGAGLRLQAFYDRTVWRAPHFEETRNTFDIDGTVQLAPLGRHQLILGTGARWSPGDFTPTVPTLDFSPRSFTSRLASAFVQDDIALVADRLSLVVGTKIEHNNYTGVEVQPNARLLWTRGVQAFWGSVARAVRTPSRIEDAIRLLSPAGPVPGVPLPVFLEVSGNNEVDVEETVAFEAGYRQLFGARVNVDVSLFHNEHDGLVSFARGPVRVDGTPPARVIVNAPHVNAVSGWSRGLEIAPAWQVDSEWRVSGSYALRRFDFTASPLTAEANAVRRYEGSSPRHVLLARVQWTRGGTEADVTYRHVSALPFRSIDGYHAADARVGWRLAPNVSIAVAGRNLFDPHHPEFPQTPAPVEIPRSVLVTARWTIAPGQ